MKEFFPAEEITMESLERNARVISMESGLVSQTLKATPSRLPAFVEDVKQFLKRHLNPFSVSVKQVDGRRLEALLRTNDYLKVSNLGVFIPTGFQGKWLDYVKLLSTSQQSINVLNNELLIPFEQFLSTVLTSSDRLKNLSVPQALMRYKEADTEALGREFAKFFGNSGNTEATFGDVVERNADLAEVTRGLNETNVQFAHIDRKILLKRVENITEMLDLLMNNIKQYPDEYQISGPTVQTLSALTLAMARQVEYYTVHGYFLEAFTTAVADSYKRLEKALSR